jgi:hypothetical protein
MRALACPASLTGVLTALDAAAALGRGCAAWWGSRWWSCRWPTAARARWRRVASFGAELLPSAELVLDEVGFDSAGFDLVVTGEGVVDATTAEGKARGNVPRAALPRGRDAMRVSGAASSSRSTTSRRTS